MDTIDDFSIYEIHVDQLYRNNPDGIYRRVYDDDEDHRHYHDHQGVYDVYQHDRDRVRRYLKYSISCHFLRQTRYIPRNLVFFGFLFNREFLAEPRAAIC